ncbi:MAG: hypothetical protein RJB38_1273 [Pseudomonadota bacterium]|jgi:3-deoxy-D-manno-octulosonic-acid transferase
MSAGVRSEQVREICSAGLWTRAKAGLYRIIVRALFSCFRFLVWRSRSDWNWKTRNPRYWPALESSPHCRLVWFHAASAGELEMLWSVARELKKKDPNLQFGFSVFSLSGEPKLNAIRDEFSPVYSGPSPLEGDWSSFFSQVEKHTGAFPSIFVTAKYEAWPELWGVLSQKKIPLLLVNAQLRRSLIWGERLARWFFGGVPELFFSTAGRRDSETLEQAFSLVTSTRKVRQCGDPRWDQVQFRLAKRVGAVDRLKLLGESEKLPRPWVVVGSAWTEDLEFLLRASMKGKGFRGTFWWVPHRLDDEQSRDWGRRIEKCQAGRILLVRAQGVSSLQSGRPSLQVGENNGCSVIVQQMGILAELYSVGDAAWVGGGFKTGLHSVIEPALSDLWIGAGALKASRFSEALELSEQGQLSLFSDQSSGADWLEKVQSPPSIRVREQWRGWREAHQLRAASRVSDWVIEIVSRL